MRLVRSRWPRALSARRFVLLATVAGLGMGGTAIGSGALHQAGLPSYAAAADAAEVAQRPVGFADLVEKVRPAVISVRVRVKAGSETIASECPSLECPMTRTCRTTGFSRTVSS